MTSDTVMYSCKGCAWTATRESFPRTSTPKKGKQYYRLICAGCLKVYRHIKWPVRYDKYRAQHMQSLWRRQGISLTYVEYTQMLAAQGGVCAICKENRSSNKVKMALAVDHCHDTGRVRALLCGRCNLGIGQFDHNTTMMSAAIDYLRRHS